MNLFRSIRIRFTGWYILVLAVLLVAMSVGMYTYLAFTLQRDLDQALVHRAYQVSAIRGVRGIVSEGRFEEMLGEIVGFYTREGDGYLVASTRRIEESLDVAWIERAFDGELVHATAESPTGQPLRFYITLFRPGGPPGLAVSAPGADAAARQRPPHTPPPGAGEPAPGVDGPVDDASLEPAVLVVAQPMDRITSALDALRTTLLLAVPLTLLLSAWGGLFLVRRALEPVDRIIATAQEIEETDLSTRVRVTTNDELGRLARTMNAMLDRLEHAFRRQRQFTDDASHELRSPLSVIEAEATLALRRERDAADYRDAIAIIAEEAGSMNRLIDQLLTLARSDAGEEQLERETVDLDALARETAVAMKPVAEELAVSLVTTGAEGVSVCGDRTRLRRVVANLVDNALRHTPSGGTVSVTVERVNGTAQLTVADTGTGIPPEDVPHIFERFYRVDKARSRSEGGSGLGLAICHTIVASHGGSMNVESSVGVGSRFIVRLPLTSTTAG